MQTGWSCLLNALENLKPEDLSKIIYTDGEKPWRNRESEFVESYPNKTTMMNAWETGWSCLLNALENLKPEDLSKIPQRRPICFGGHSTTVGALLLACRADYVSGESNKGK
jgi:hypothetical protein